MEKYQTQARRMDYQSVETLVMSKLKNELPPQYKFHNWKHTEDVIRHSQLIAVAEGIDGVNMLLIKTAALFHDLGYVFMHCGHESVGARFAAEVLPGFAYTAEQIELIQGMILATRYPQMPQNELEKILCDADLFYLTGSDIDFQCDCLRLEFETQDTCFSDLEWYEFEKRFIVKHHFFTPFAQEAFNKVKPEILRQLDENIRIERQNEKNIY